MDWCVDPAVPGARRAVEADLAAHLARRVPDTAACHAAVGQLAVHLDRRTPGGGPWRLTLRWRLGQAQVAVRPMRPEGRLPGTPLAAGATACAWDLEELAAVTVEEPHWVDLGLHRPAEPVLDPDPGDTELPAHREGFLTSVAATATGLSGYSSAGRCAFVGAAAARRAEADYRRGHHVDRSLTAGEVAEAFVDLQQGIGGDFTVVEVDADHAVVANHTCPFGAAVTDAPQLCRVTSAMLGSLAARSWQGQAWVSLDERIALGDRRCLLTVRRSPDGAASDHRYHWPPSGLTSFADETSAKPPPGHGISLALQLPRDRVSVPVIRHLASAALAEVGVTAEVAADIELALSEACSNVLDHAGPGDAYEVAVAIRAERCELRIIDTGRGFDHVSIRDRRAGHDDERGRGLALMQAVMDHVAFTSEPQRGTLVTLVKQLTFDEDSPGQRLLRQDGTAPGATSGGTTRASAAR